nr:unnamed protein product [Digitaria exilis]
MGLEMQGDREQGHESHDLVLPSFSFHPDPQLVGLPHPATGPQAAAAVAGRHAAGAHRCAATREAHSRAALALHAVGHRYRRACIGSWGPLLDDADVVPCRGDRAVEPLEC